MDIAVIGGGFTGLTAAYTLTKLGHRVSIFEKESFLGGLAYGFTFPGWEWHMEGAYHHLFTNDNSILSLLQDLGLKDDLIIKRPITASLWHSVMYQLDSPISLFTFPGLGPVDKFRTAILLAFLKVMPFWQPLEGITAEQLLVSIGGKNAFTTIWEPLLYGKFGEYAPKVAASWFWARIQKRTPSLCYIRGGFHTLVEALRAVIIKNGGTILTSTVIHSVKRTSADSYTLSWGSNKQTFDRILLTIPTPAAFKLIPDLPSTDKRYAALSAIPHLFAQTLILETDAPILKDVYWLNVTDRSFPFLAAVAHTNFMDKTHYGGHHLTYFGNYLPQGHRYLSMTAQELLKEFRPFIHSLSSGTRYKILHTHMFIGPFAQPVHTRHYSQKIPPITTPLPSTYLANMDFIYPWDRGTNYAVELGQRAANLIVKKTI